MRIRKRRPTATSADGGDPNPPPLEQCCGDAQSDGCTAVGRRCQYHYVKAESLRSELVPSAAVAEEKKKPNSTTSAAATTTTTTSAPHDRCTYNTHMSRLIMRKQREASPVEDPSRTTVATSQLDAGPRGLHHTKKAPVSTGLEQEMNFSSLFSSRSEPNNSSFRPAAAAALAVLSGQSKHEEEDLNVESDLEGIQRHIPSGWAMPSLQGLRSSRSRSRSNSHSMPKPLQNDVSLAGTKNSNSYNSLRDEAQLISMSSRSSESDCSLMQGVQQACRQTINWPEVAVKTAGPHCKLPFTRFYKEIAPLGQLNMKMVVQVGKIKRTPEDLLVRSKSGLVDNNIKADQKRGTTFRSSTCSRDGPKIKRMPEDLLVRIKSGLVDNNINKADQKRETPFRSSTCSSDGSKMQLLQTSDKLKMSFQEADGKINGSGNCGIKAYPSKFAEQSSNIKPGSATATRENGAGDGDVLDDQLLCPSTSSINMVATGTNNTVSKERERNDDYMIATAAGSDKLGKGSNNKYHIIGKQISTHVEEAKRMKTKLGEGSAGMMSDAGTSRWRKKCRPVFRSINDIQRRAPLLHNNTNTDTIHYHHPAAASDVNIDHIIDVPASISDHREYAADTTQADNHASSTASACGAASVRNDQHNPNSITTSHIDIHSLDVRRSNGGKPDDNVVLTKRKKKKEKPNKINKSVMTIMAVVAEAAHQEQPLMISRLSKKSCKAAHRQLLYHQHLAAVQQPVTPDRHDAAASHRSLPAIQLNLDTSSPAHHHPHLHQAGDYNNNVESQPINCRCSLNGDPFEWRPDFSHFI